MKKIGILIIILVLISLGIYVYISNKDIASLDSGFQNISRSMKNTKESPTSTGIIEKTDAQYDPTVIRTQTGINNVSGVSVTISTNGPPVRPMTQEEIDAFQKKMLGK